MKQTIALIIIFTFILSACGPQGITLPFSPSQQDVHVGTQGITMEFMPSAPPSEIKEGQDFPVYIDLRNQGAYDVDRGFWKLSGLTHYLNFYPNQGTYTLRGRSLGDSVGERQILQIEGRSGRLVDQIQKMQEEYYDLSVCYPYQTKAAVQVCVDTDYFNEKQQQKVCSVGTEQVSGGQGGPVGILSVESLPPRLPREEDGLANPDLVIPVFRITLANLGTGRVVESQRAGDFCLDRGEPSSRNIISYDIQLSDLPLACTETGGRSLQAGQPIKLDEESNQLQLDCELPQGLSKRFGTYTAPLQLTLDYGYVDKVTQSLIIIDIED